MFPLIRSTGSKKQSKLAAHAPFSCRLTAPISIPSNNSSQDSNRSYAKRRRALLSSFGEQSPLFSKGFPKKNAKLISQTRATPNLIEKCSRRPTRPVADIAEFRSIVRSQSRRSYKRVHQCTLAHLRQSIGAKRTSHELAT